MSENEMNNNASGLSPELMEKKPEKKPEKKESKLVSVLIVLFFGISGVWMIFSGIKGLFLGESHPIEDVFQGISPGAVYEGEITKASTEFCSLKHTINLIPAGTEHFFLIYAEDLSSAVLVRADKSFDDDFTDSSMNEVSITGRGLARRLDYKVRDELESSGISDYLSVEQGYYIDLISGRICCLQMIAGIGILVLLIYGYWVLEKVIPEQAGKINQKNGNVIFLIVLFFIVAILMIYVLNMAGL